MREPINGVSQGQVARVEAGKDFRFSTLQRLFEALGFRVLVFPSQRALPDTIGASAGVDSS